MSSIKFILIGDSGVGKTCLINQYSKQEFTEEHITTVTAGGDKTFKDVNLGNKTVKLEIWDTAGQERYRSISKLLYKDAGVAILVYDITERHTFDEIKDYWYKEIKENSQGNIILGIAGNKSDLYENEKVSEEEGRNFASEIGAIFKLTSSLENFGITELFKRIGYKILSPDGSNPLGDNQGFEEVEENPIKLNDVKVKKKKKCC